MPSPYINCEFCEQATRKDRYGSHVATKHIEQLAQQLLEDSDKDILNPIQSIVKNRLPWNYPIYSRRVEGAVWYFGVKPRYFEADDSYRAYIKDENNMTAHRRFIESIITNINLLEFLKKTNGVLPCTKNNITDLQCAIDNLKEIIKQKNQEIDTLRSTDYRVRMDEIKRLCD